MNFQLTRPCHDCPFRKVGGVELRPGRLERIVQDMLADDRNWFWCHKDAYGPRPISTVCAGSMIYLLKVGQQNLAMRAAAAMGLLDFDELRAQFDVVVDPLPTQRKRLNP